MRLRQAATAATALILTAVLAACSNSNQNAETNSGETITIKHAYGETVIEGTPERIATVAWGNHEVPLALDVMPVGMSKANWGDEDNDGMLPWVAERVETLGGEAPVLFDDTDALPYEDIAATEPDVILAASSGLSEDEYKQLSNIAPTVAFPKQAWGTSMNEMIELNATAMGKKEAGKQLITDLEGQVSTVMADHPELAGKSFLFTAFGSESDTSKIGFYTTDDARVSFLEDAGLTIPQVVADNSATAGTFWAEVSAEKPELFEDVDFIIAYGTNDEAANEKQLKKLQDDPLIGRIPAIADGRVVFLGEGSLAALTTPTPLNIPWGLDQYFDALETAAAN